MAHSGMVTTALRPACNFAHTLRPVLAERVTPGHAGYPLPASYHTAIRRDKLACHRDSTMLNQHQTRSHRHPASYPCPVDGDDLTRDTAGDVRHQVRDQPGHLVSLPHALEAVSASAPRPSPRHPTMPVSIRPGATQFTVILRLASSSASALVAP